MGDLKFWELMTSGNVIYLLNFKKESDCIEVLSKGMRTVGGAPFILKKWEAGDNLKMEERKHMRI